MIFRMTRMSTFRFDHTNPGDRDLRLPVNAGTPP
jgi:hypothetical protein